MGKVESWRAAVTEAANLEGYDLQHYANGNEAELIGTIVEKALLEVNPIYLNVATQPVLIESRVKDINTLLRVGTDDVSRIGIYGMGGIGKTTITKAVYNKNCHYFEGSCFLANVREVSKELNGLVHLQEQLLSEILKVKNFDVGNVDRKCNGRKTLF